MPKRSYLRLVCQLLVCRHCAILSNSSHARSLPQKSGVPGRENKESFLLIGRYLLAAKGRLQHGEFMAMVTSDLPFSHQTANKLMSVARFIEAGEMPLDALPSASETCYQITTLTADERTRALAEGVIRPTMRRQDILQFKRRIRMQPETEVRTSPA